MQREHKKTLKETLDLGNAKLQGSAVLSATTAGSSAILSPEIKLDGNPMEITV